MYKKAPGAGIDSSRQHRGLGEVRAIEARQSERQTIKVIKDEDKYKS